MSENDSHSGDDVRRYPPQDVISYVHDYGLDVKKREIYLFGREEAVSRGDSGDIYEPGVDFMMANQFIKNLRLLQSIATDPILIHMKTCGGDWHEGMAIYDAIKACPNYIVILNYTHARSMSSLIFESADYRVMMPNSTFMFHEGTNAFDGTYKQWMSEVKQNLIYVDVMLDIYVDAMKNKGKYKRRSRAWIKEWIQNQMNIAREHVSTQGYYRALPL